ncbi:unnamed protein product, partial [Protopolystoma xenopodis]
MSHSIKSQADQSRFDTKIASNKDKISSKPAKTSLGKEKTSIKSNTHRSAKEPAPPPIVHNFVNTSEKGPKKPIIISKQPPQLSQSTNGHDDSLSSTTSTEAKREKHRNKKQNQRAVKRLATETTAGGLLVSPDLSQSLTQIPSNPQDDSAILQEAPLSPSLSTAAVLHAAGVEDMDNEEEWNALVKSQAARYASVTASRARPHSPSGSATNGGDTNWTVVMPQSSSRAQRSVNVPMDSAAGTEWKSASANGNVSAFCSNSKRRIAIQVSRHDIGKVIGQGGAVVSALRNMTGIQIDIESARSDEVTERMVYLRGPSDGVQRTHDLIQGLISGTITGNDVLSRHAVFKRSGATSGNCMISLASFIGNSVYTSPGISSKQILSSYPSSLSFTISNSSSVSAASSIRLARKPAKSNLVTSAPLAATISAVVGKSVPNSTTGKPVSFNTNNNNPSNSQANMIHNTGKSTGVLLPPQLSSTWGKGKGNFAAVAAAGVLTPSPTGTVIGPRQAATGIRQTSSIIPNVKPSQPASSHLLPMSLLSVTNTDLVTHPLSVISNSPKSRLLVDDSSFPPLTSLSVSVSQTTSLTGSASQTTAPISEEKRHPKTASTPANLSPDTENELPSGASFNSGVHLLQQSVPKNNATFISSNLTTLVSVSDVKSQLSSAPSESLAKLELTEPRKPSLAQAQSISSSLTVPL